MYTIISGPGLYTTWTQDNPYLHTSRPYVVPLQPPVRPDQQYPTTSMYHTDTSINHSSLHPLPSCLQLTGYPYPPEDPLYESINSVRIKPSNLFENQGKIVEIYHFFVSTLLTHFNLTFKVLMGVGGIMAFIIGLLVLKYTVIIVK